MLTDLRSIRNWAGYLQKTEIKFDMLSAVDELAKQVRCQHPAISVSIWLQKALLLETPLQLKHGGNLSSVYSHKSA